MTVCPEPDLSSDLDSFLVWITHPFLESFLSEHPPLTPSLQFGLIWDHPKPLDIIYAFEPQWAVRKKRSGSHSLCCQENPFMTQINPWTGQRHAFREGGLWQIQIIAIVLYSNSLLPTALSYFISSTQKDLPPPRPSISPPFPQFTRLPSVSEPQQKPQLRFKLESMPQAR